MSSSSSPFNSLLSSNNPDPYDFSKGDLTEQAHAPGLDANNILSMSQLADFSPPTNILNIFKQVFKALWWVVKGAASLFWFSLENSATAETEKYDLNMDDWNTPKNKSNKSYSGEEKNYIRINGYDKQGNTVRM